MKKRMLSLLCVLALCLGLLPTAALAAGEDAPDTLYVGNQQVIRYNDTTYWTTDASGTLTQSSENADWTVRYNPNTATLTLRGATINGAYDATSLPFGAGIYAQGRSNQAVALTIELIGTNTITGIYGIYLHGHQGGTVSTNASLSITGDGSLTVTGTTSYGLHVISGTGNASLTIEDASVVASSSSSYSHAGVCVQSGADATNSPELSLAVNGGSLTASASEGNDGIQFYVGSPEATGATTSLTVTDNAIVDARTGGISATRVSTELPTPTPTGDNSSGIVFDGTEGTVYGDVTLDTPLTVVAGETLTIPEGSTLNGNSNLTNNGTVTIENGGTLTGADKVTNSGTINVENGGKLEGTPTGTVVYAPTITTQPVGQTVTVGQTAEFTVAASGENLSYQWQYRNDNGTNWNSISDATGNSYTTDAATLEMNNYQYQCVVSNSAGSVTSDPVTLTVKSVPVTGVTLDPTELSLYTGESETLTAKVVPETATDKSVTWESSNTDVATVKDGTVTAVKEGTATITATANDGSGQYATCTVTVTDKTYTITADPAKLDFDAAYLGYKTQPAPQTVTITNTGNQQVTVTLPTAKDFVITAGDGFTNGRATIEPGKTATFTVQPKADLAVGSYKESINISGSNGNHTVSTSVDASFAVVDINNTSVNNKLTVTSGISDNITYYTCPSCGYHNWTATDAGYRCDNCGYLESTKQLSGYGNVKGTYTPGSGATSTAASTVPQTGDESNPVLWTVLLLVSGLALGGLAIAKRKKQQ